jgi:hypothetical protein
VVASKHQSIIFHSRMRTTLAIDDDILRLVKSLAEMEDKSLGQKVSELLRKSLAPDRSGEKSSVGGIRWVAGLPVLPKRKGSKRVTIEEIRKIRDEDPFL